MSASMTTENLMALIMIGLGVLTFATLMLGGEPASYGRHASACLNAVAQFLLHTGEYADRSSRMAPHTDTRRAGDFASVQKRHGW